MRSGLVLVSFGTSVPEARRAVTAVEDVLRRTAPDWETVQAFTSPTILRILAKRGEDVPSLPEALERLRSKGVRRAAVQPTHLLYGFEYDRLRAEAEALSGGFDALTVGRPCWQTRRTSGGSPQDLTGRTRRRTAERWFFWAMARNISPTRSIPPSRPPCVWRAVRTCR